MYLKYFFFIVLCTFPDISSTQASILRIPVEQPTIQAGIDSAAVGDTVLIAPGIFTENINFNGKNIVVGSHFITTGDLFFISQTIINGNENGAVVTFENNEDSSAILVGLSIINGKNENLEGGGIYCANASPRLLNLAISKNFAAYGGGVYCRSSNVKIENCIIQRNNAGSGGGISCNWTSTPAIRNTVIRNNSAYNGGGIFCNVCSPHLFNVLIEDNISTSTDPLQGGGGVECYMNSFPLLSRVTIRNNKAIRGGAIFCRIDSRPQFDSSHLCSIYNNKANIGADFYATSVESVHVVVDTFSVQIPTSYYATPKKEFTFEIQHALMELKNADLYVNPNGDDQNSGLIPEQPLRTIDFALSQIQSDSANQRTIYLSEGVYSPSANGENFPLNIFASLHGINHNATILDAEKQSDLLHCHYVSPVTIQDLTIQNGKMRDGVGMIIRNSSPKINRVIISGCESSRYGGGLYIWTAPNPMFTEVSILQNKGSAGGGLYCYASNPVFKNVRISQNWCSWDGGGAVFVASNPILDHVIVAQNKNPQSTIYSGGGIYCYQSNPLIINCTIVDNGSVNGGGGIFCKDDTNPVIINSILWDNSPFEIYFEAADVSSVFAPDSRPNSVRIAYTDIQNRMCEIETNDNGTIHWEEGNMTEIPEFIDSENGNYALVNGSPCIDAGTTRFVVNEDTLFKVDIGEYFGNAPDMGALEFDDATLVKKNDFKPKHLILHPNYPNPFNAATKICYELPEQSQVSICIFNMLGQTVRTVAVENQNAGLHQFTWRGQDDAGNEVPSGVYVCRIRANGVVLGARKMVVLR